MQWNYEMPDRGGFVEFVAVWEPGDEPDGTGGPAAPMALRLTALRDTDLFRLLHAAAHDSADIQVRIEVLREPPPLLAMVEKQLARKAKKAKARKRPARRKAKEKRDG